MLPSAKSGLYAIRDPCTGDRDFSSAIIAVNCDMDTDGGGWTVIQRRNASLGRVNFVRDWNDYENGFGDLDGEFWIGLKNIYELTRQQRMELQVLAWNDSRASVTRDYTYFAISGASQKYALSRDVGTGNGDGNPVFSYDGYVPRTFLQYFSTFDRDNDRSSSTNCAYTDQGGWWYYRCDGANLNGRHQPTHPGGTRPLQQRLVWRTSSAPYYDIYTHSEMKIRPQNCGLGSG